MHMLRLFFVFGEFQAPSIGLEYVLKCVESLSMDPFGCKFSWNDAKEDGGKRRKKERKMVLVHLDMAAKVQSGGCDGTFVGPYDFRDHGIADGIVELAD